MQAMPTKARFYLYTIWSLAGIISLCLLPFVRLGESDFWLLLWGIGYAAADYFEVRFNTEDNNVSMTLAEAATIFLVAVGGISSIYVVIIATTLIEIARKRIWYKTLFNISSRVIIISIMVLVYKLFYSGNEIPFITPVGFIAFISLSLTLYFLSAIIIGLIVALTTNVSINNVYKDSYKLVQWIHLLTFPIGALMAVHWYVDRWLLVYDIIILLIAHRSFLIVAQLQTESHQRKELAEERGRLLEELRLRQEELISASKLAALGTFSAGIAHEFGNLLAVVDGQAQVGLMSNDASEMRQSLNMTLITARRGRTITQGLLTFARQGESQKIMTQLQEVIEDTLNMIQSDFEQAGVQIVRHLQPLPPTSCDPGQIMQVLLNILGNARDALHERDGGTITFTTRHENGQIFMAITDNGSGIELALLEQLFQPFVTTKGALGTGLGLAICYGIVEGHRGQIKVDSIVGQGTTMTIRLPVVEKYEPGIIVTQQDSIRIGTATPANPLRI